MKNANSDLKILLLFRVAQNDKQLEMFAFLKVVN